VEDQMRKIFVDSYYLNPILTTKAKGQVFGLPAVKRMTDALSGAVSFESQEGKGTTFVVRLLLTQRNGK
jgi:nitrogen-specific signal transduction histidine kinase